MFATWIRAARFVRPATAFALLAGIACTFGLALTGAVAADTDIVKVEEDWELVVKQPDLTTVSPQVTCIISPHGNADGLFAAFNLNHKSYPTWEPGGLQLQLWNGSTPMTGYNFPRNELLNTADEVVRWTQSMAVTGPLLKFEIKNGSSTTWGSFGGQGFLTASVEAAVENLNNYSPNVSTTNSGISYAANRVTSLKLLKVRAHNRLGTVVEDDDVKVVFEHE
jgi:hypothetical protein